jgi:hypothetical protein
VVVCGAETLTAFIGTTGRQSWSFSLREIGEEWRIGEKTRFVSADGRLFVCSSRALLSMDLESGQPVWATRRKHAEETSPVVSGRFLYVRSDQDANVWARYLVEDGTNARDEATYGEMDPDPERLAKKRAASRIFLSADRRSMHMLVGGRRVSYRAPEPFTIAGVLGESSGVVCLQLVAYSPTAPSGG